MEMIDRYVYAVTKRLPEAQRKDVSDELLGLIEDMLDERVQGRKTTDKDVEKVLLELGPPKRLAQKYRGTKKYIIGPELYDFYVLVLKIALISVVAGFTAVFVIQVILNPMNMLDYFIDYIVSFFTAIIPNVIGWTTLGFALAEYFSEGELSKVKVDKEWHPSNLAPIPDPKRQIKPSEPIIAIVVSVLLIVFFAASHEYFGIWAYQNGEMANVISFLNESAYGSFLILIIIFFVFIVMKECLKLFYGRWTKSLVIYTAVINVISIGIIMVLVSGRSFWNPNFMNELVQYNVVTRGTNAYQTIQIIWEQLTLWILVFLLIGLVWEIVAGLFKVRKQNKN
ncbi:hypothetical protein ACDX78_22615 [Virgibacillus oceani]